MNQRGRLGFARAGLLLSAAYFAACGGGCAAPDPRPTYVTPKLSTGELATLKCDWHFNVTEVDGARVPEPPVTFYFAPGGTVKVAPGERTIGVAYDDGGNTYGSRRFTYNFQAGHVYKIGPPGAFASGVRVTDKSTDTSTVIH
jgi:hypothetical protein